MPVCEACCAEVQTFHLIYNHHHVLSNKSCGKHRKMRYLEKWNADFEHVLLHLVSVTTRVTKPHITYHETIF